MRCDIISGPLGPIGPIEVIHYSPANGIYSPGLRDRVGLTSMRLLKLREQAPPTTAAVHLAGFPRCS